MIITSQITHNRCGERETAESLIKEMISAGTYNDLILFDKGYPSSTLINFIESKNLSYLMRVSSGFFKAVVEVPASDKIVNITHKKINLKMRVIKFTLESGIDEILITNIFDSYFSIEDFKKLYFKRWGIEVKYK